MNSNEIISQIQFGAVQSGRWMMCVAIALTTRTTTTTTDDERQIKIIKIKQNLTFTSATIQWRYNLSQLLLSVFGARCANNHRCETIINVESNINISSYRSRTEHRHNLQ